MTFREKRSHWLKRLAWERASWIAQHPIVKEWRLLGKEINTRRGLAILCECICGEKQYVNFYDLKRGGTNCCKSCAGKKRVRRDKRLNHAAFIARCKKGAAERAKTHISKYTTEELYVAGLMRNAKKRCTGKKHKNYGGRGIKFSFPSIEFAAKWIIKELGPRPSKKHSIDRVDNNRHYEIGNLRWATASEQMRNRRAKKPSQWKLRMLRLMALRPDYSREGISTLITRGLTDAQIMKIEKKGGRPRKNA